MTSKRELSSLNETALLQGHVKIIIYARLDFLSGVQRWHTEIGPRTINHPIYGSELYQGIGDFGGISSDLKESVSSAPEPLALAITGLDAGLINMSLTDDYFRRDAELLLGLEDGSGNLVDDPLILYSGYMDKVDVALEHNQAQMALNLESRGTNFLKASDLRFTDEDLQIEYPGDLAGEYIYAMYDLVLKWGVKTTYGYGGGGGVGPGGPGTPRTQIH